MVNINNKGYTSPIAIHPAETINEALEYAGLSQVDLASRMDLSEKTISQILNEAHPVTPESAAKFERVLGLSAILLLNLQAAFDADKFRLDEKKRFEGETNFLPQFSCFNELVKLGFINKTSDKLKKVDELLNFFALNSLGDVEKVFPFAFKISQMNKVNPTSLAAWLRIGEIKTQGRIVKDYNKDILLSNLPKIRALTTNNPETYSQALVEYFSEAGIVLVYTPHLKQTRVNGATRWITPNKALIQVSLYQKWADIFWFTVFHEIGHLIKDSKKEVFIDDFSSDNKHNETEANKFAENLLIPSEKNSEFEIVKNKIKNTSDYQAMRKILETFSKSIDVDMGLVAGRIANELGNWKEMAMFRKKLSFNDK